MLSPLKRCRLHQPDNTSATLAISTRAAFQSGFFLTVMSRYHKTHGHSTQQLHENGDGTFSIVNPETSTPYPGTLGMEKEKPFKCEACGKRYKNLNGLKYVSITILPPSLVLRTGKAHTWQSSTSNTRRCAIPSSGLNTRLCCRR